MRRRNEDQHVELSLDLIQLMRHMLGEFLRLQLLRIVPGSDAVMHRGVAVERSAWMVAAQIGRLLMRGAGLDPAFGMQHVMGIATDDAGMLAIGDGDEKTLLSVVWTFAADTQEKADYWFRSRAIIQTLRSRGRFLPLPTPEEAETVELTEIEKERLKGIKSRAFVGTGRETANRLRALCAELKADELVITTGVTDHEIRRNSFKLLAEAFGLNA